MSFAALLQGQAAVVVQEVQNSHTADDEVAQEAEYIGDIAEDEKADDGGENDLRVVIDRDFPGGGVAVSAGDSKLTAGGTDACQQEVQRLLQGHGGVVK